MGQIEAKKSETNKLVKIHHKNKNLNELELNVNSKLNITRRQLKNSIDFPFIFLDDNENEINEIDESSSTLGDILDGKKLHIKKKLEERKILGKKIDSKDGLNFYLYPKIYLTDIQEKNSSNIMVIGETGVGKSTWIHSLLNYLEGIEIDENIRYLLFDEKQKQKEYEINNQKKSSGSSVTDIPEIYEIAPTQKYNHPIRIIDTTGFGDTRGIEYDNKIIKDIANLIENSGIDNLKAICLIFKASETRAHDRLKYIMEKLFSLFGEDTKNNFIIIFNFVDSFTDISITDVLKNKGLPFFKIFGDIETLTSFYFNNKAYFVGDKYLYDIAYENNNKNFTDFFKYLLRLKPVSLNKTKIILHYRIEMREKVAEINKNLTQIKKAINIMRKNHKILLNEKKSIFDKYNSPYVLYCNNHNKICHKNCFGTKLCSHFIKKNICDTCNCGRSMHNFLMNYNDQKEKEYNTKISKEIYLSNEEFMKSNNKIYHYFMICFETFQNLIFKNKELNSLSLIKEDEEEKNGYIHNLLNEIIKEKDELTDFIKQSIQKLEKLNEDEKEYMIYNFLDKIVTQKLVDFT